VWGDSALLATAIVGLDVGDDDVIL
jgi:hypothetical protein